MAMDVSNVYNRYLGNFVHTPKADLKKTDGANKEGQAGQVQPFPEGTSVAGKA